MHSAVKEIAELFSRIPPDLDTIDQLIGQSTLTKEELAYLACCLGDQCFGEYGDALNPEVKTITLDHMNSNFLVPSLKLLLKHGLDPNTVSDDRNVMWALRFADAPYVGANALKLLLEAGGDANHYIPAEGEGLFSSVSFDVSYDYDEYDALELHLVHQWLLLMAYGGCYSDGTIPLKMSTGYDVTIFKDFQNYDFHISRRSDEWGDWTMKIFDVHTNKCVATW